MGPDFITAPRELIFLFLSVSIVCAIPLTLVLAINLKYLLEITSSLVTTLSVITLAWIHLKGEIEEELKYCHNTLNIPLLEILNRKNEEKNTESPESREAYTTLVRKGKFVSFKPKKLMEKLYEAFVAQSSSQDGSMLRSLVDYVYESVWKQNTKVLFDNFEKTDKLLLKAAEKFLPHFASILSNKKESTEEWRFIVVQSQLVLLKHAGIYPSSIISLLKILNLPLHFFT